MTVDCTKAPLFENKLSCLVSDHHEKSTAVSVRREEAESDGNKTATWENETWAKKDMAAQRSFVHEVIDSVDGSERYFDGCKSFLNEENELDNDGGLSFRG